MAQRPTVRISSSSRGRRRGARVLSAKGGRDCRAGVLPRQDALWTRGAGCPTDRFAGLLLARAPRSEQYRVTLRASCGSTDSAPEREVATDHALKACVGQAEPHLKAPAAR